MSQNKWWHTEENDTVATSRELWEPLSDRIGGFDLDPAAGCEPTPIADTRYTESDDGLTSEWFGTVWLNPPFSAKETWYKKLVEQYTAGNIDRAIALAQAGTDADWFQEWFSTADYIVFLNGRDYYIQNGVESFASMLGLWNPTPEVVEWCHTKGVVVEPKDDPRQQRFDEIA